MISEGDGLGVAESGQEVWMGDKESSLQRRKRGTPLGESAMSVARKMMAINLEKGRGGVLTRMGKRLFSIQEASATFTL